MTNQLTLAGKTAFITGGSGAIGMACAKALLRDGARVLIMGRRADKLTACREQLLSEIPGAQIETYAGDALSVDDLKTALDKAYQLNQRLDIVVPTVGGGGFMPLLMQDLDGLRNELDMNLGSVFLAVRHSVPLMQKGGSIVCISSTAGVLPFPYLSSYCAGKAALEGFMRSAADELASAGIRLNAVRPGLTRSEATESMFANDDVMASFYQQIPLARTGEPEDIANAVRYLAGPESSWTTGQSFAVDGGQELRRHPDMTPLVESAFGSDALKAIQSGKPVS